MTPRVQGGKLETRSRAQQIADYYIGLIQCGRITEGEQLPGRAEIVRVWQVGGKTAQNALECLRNQGWAVAVAKQASYAAWPDKATALRLLVCASITALREGSAGKRSGGPLPGWGSAITTLCD